MTQVIVALVENAEPSNWTTDPAQLNIPPLIAVEARAAIPAAPWPSGEARRLDGPHHVFPRSVDPGTQEDYRNFGLNDTERRKTARVNQDDLDVMRFWT
jgi:hypothetical protein